MAAVLEAPPARCLQDIEAEHRELLASTARRLDELAKEHQAVRGHLTPFAVGCEGQARRIREYIR